MIPLGLFHDPRKLSVGRTKECASLRSSFFVSSARAQVRHLVGSLELIPPGLLIRTCMRTSPREATDDSIAQSRPIILRFRTQPALRSNPSGMRVTLWNAIEIKKLSVFNQELFS